MPTNHSGGPWMSAQLFLTIIAFLVALYIIFFTGWLG